MVIQLKPKASLTVKRLAVALIWCFAWLSLPAQQQAIEDPLEEDESRDPTTETLFTEPAVSTPEPQLSPSAPPSVAHQVDSINTQPFGELSIEQQYDILLRVNERLRREVDLLAQEVRNAGDQNELYSLIAGGAIGVVFLGLGAWLGFRIGSNRRVL